MSVNLKFSCFTIDGKVNFKTFDTKLADDWVLNQNIPDEYAQWFKDNKININALKPTDIAKLRESFKLVWHEHQNTFNAQLISNSIHTARYGGISHLGGISILKKIEEANKLASTLNSIRRET